MKKIKCKVPRLDQQHVPVDEKRKRSWKIAGRPHFAIAEKTIKLVIENVGASTAKIN